ncbi:MAG: hypothetical protein WC707_06400 [Candidatus Babeliaceae bacterium]
MNKNITAALTFFMLGASSMHAVDINITPNQAFVATTFIMGSYLLHEGITFYKTISGVKTCTNCRPEIDRSIFPDTLKRSITLSATHIGGGAALLTVAAAKSGVLDYTLNTITYTLPIITERPVLTSAAALGGFAFWKTGLPQQIPAYSCQFLKYCKERLSRD